MTYIFKVKICERCKGTGLLVWQEPGSAMHGFTKPCDECSLDYRKFVNNYGKDEDDSHPINQYKINESGLITIKRINI